MHASDPPAEPDSDPAAGPRQALAALRKEFTRWGIIHDAQGSWRAVRGRTILVGQTAEELHGMLRRASAPPMRPQSDPRGEPRHG